MASPNGSSAKGLAARCALLVGSLALLVGCGFVNPTTLPNTQDFSDFDKWAEDDDKEVSLSCEEGHYHFVVKGEPYSQSSALESPSAPMASPCQDRGSTWGIGDSRQPCS